MCLPVEAWRYISAVTPMVMTPRRIDAAHARGAMFGKAPLSMLVRPCAEAVAAPEMPNAERMYMFINATIIGAIPTRRANTTVCGNHDPR